MKRSKSNVFLTRELLRYGSPSQVSRALRELIDEQFIIKAGSGVYFKARQLECAGKLYIVPKVDREAAILEILRKLKIETYLTNAQQDYYERRTTQIPGVFKVNTGKRRISRKLFGISRYRNGSTLFQNDYGKSKPIKRISFSSLS